MTIEQGMDGKWHLTDDYRPDEIDRKLRRYLDNIQTLVTRYHQSTGDTDLSAYEEERQEAQYGFEHAMKLWSEKQRGAEGTASSTLARATIGGIISRWWIRRAVEKARRRA